MTDVTNTTPRTRLRARYDQMWTDAIDHIHAGSIDIDPVLAAREPDRRRTFTVIVRPPEPVRAEIASLMSELKAIEPNQYYYSPADLHVTVLSLFTAVTDFHRFFAKQPEYFAAVDAAMTDARPLHIGFTGVTASRAAVMIQGLMDDSALNDLRDRIRAELHARNLTEGLDSRYRLETAHMTIVRFAKH